MLLRPRLRHWPPLTVPDDKVYKLWSFNDSIHGWPPLTPRRASSGLTEPSTNKTTKVFLSRQVRSHGKYPTNGKNPHFVFECKTLRLAHYLRGTEANVYGFQLQFKKHHYGKISVRPEGITSISLHTEGEKKMIYSSSQSFVSLQIEKCGIGRHKYPTITTSITSPDLPSLFPQKMALLYNSLYAFQSLSLS